jgi:hypothetical protein
MGERRLGDVQLLGRTGEVAVARNRLDVSELTEFQRINRKSRSIL